jgi:virginiamycin B lyase
MRVTAARAQYCNCGLHVASQLRFILQNVMRQSVLNSIVVALPLVAFVALNRQFAPAQAKVWNIKDVQRPFASLKPSAMLRLGATADWVLITDDAVWVGSSKPDAVHRIDPGTNTEVATIGLPGEVCSGLEFGFGSVWIPLCGKHPALARIDAKSNVLAAVLPIAPAGAEAGITASSDSVWMVTDHNGTLSRINPRTNTVRQTVHIPAGSYNPVFSEGIIWITGFATNVLTVVDASSGNLLGSVPVGRKPRFLTAGGGSVWTLNQGDGTVSRVDAKTRKVTATISTGIPSAGGDICYGIKEIWTTVFDVPLTRIDPQTNAVLWQWVGHGGDSMRFGHNSLWMTDYKKGLLLRFPDSEVVQP